MEAHQKAGAPSGIRESSEDMHQFGALHGTVTLPQCTKAGRLSLR
jgi:hypothetical protein